MVDRVYDEQFKIVLVGNSGVGKSSILLRFTDDVFDDLPPTIGVDFKVKSMKVDGKNVKMTLWDTAGQERFRTLTSAYYRGAHGIILVYDVTKRESFDALSGTWLKEVETYCTRDAVVKMLVGNKVDKDGRQVSRQEGSDFARAASTLFVESSAKTTLGVQQCFEELIRKILEVPSLCASGAQQNNDAVGLAGSTGDSASYCSC
eukprot:Plantae.Rhodophyta-Rhodochaete_pulchella.ctg6385.p1 GENE.Plantae.Rhodophyta-Rhodochaete_pulchella.ctg6385~~Plantae.Rhodophyta-Rhodochaete_pulchella.ctg6385.p1  ORF type:complete len:237 (-),score=39.51 Plantae.Rhodophyta-Rhodochaete_pulchella.ctg6385:127-738(-)